MGAGEKTLLIGLGHPYRSDDGFGPLAIETLKNVYGDAFEYVQHPGDPADLIERWNQRSVIILDALCVPDPKPGTVHSLRPLEGAALPGQKSLSSHALSLAEALELGQILQKLPAALVIVGVEAENFAPGTGLSPAVAQAMSEVVPLIPTLLQ